MARNSSEIRVKFALIVLDPGDLSFIADQGRGESRESTQTYAASFDGFSPRPDRDLAAFDLEILSRARITAVGRARSHGCPAIAGLGRRTSSFRRVATPPALSSIARDTFESRYRCR